MTSLHMEAMADWMRGVVYYGPPIPARPGGLPIPAYRYRGLGRLAVWDFEICRDFPTVDAFDKAACRWWAGLI
jgi:hypothetical protein